MEANPVKRDAAHDVGGMFNVRNYRLVVRSFSCRKKILRLMHKIQVSITLQKKNLYARFTSVALQLGIIVPLTPSSKR
jgi:hypothetical protein